MNTVSMAHRIRLHAGIAFLGVCMWTDASSAAENYRESLSAGTNSTEVKQLYDQYAEHVLGQPGAQLEEIDKLAGGSEYRYPFLLACLANGWEIRAQDMTARLRPPAGAWLYSKKNFQGRLLQVTRQAPALRFAARSVRLGDSIDAQVFSATEYGGPARPRLRESAADIAGIRSLKLQPGPRIDFVTVSDCRISAGIATLKLHVSGANLDQDAVIRIDEKPLKTKRRVVLDNTSYLHVGEDLAKAGYPMDTAYLGYPIYHYALLTADLSQQTAGSCLKVQVVNSDGQTSNRLDYEIVNRMADLDSDGDGLPDEWETNGYDANGDGVVDVDLKALGANPQRKDIFVEVDRMIVRRRVWSLFSASSYPRSSIWSEVVQIFDNAPVLNADGTAGISILIDHGQADLRADRSIGHPIPGEGGSIVKWTKYIGFGENESASGADNYTDLHVVKKNKDYFDPHREKIFRYCVFADQQVGRLSSGYTGTSSFMVTLGGWKMQAIDPSIQKATFVHELGHTFGLRHGGEQKPLINYKPNFNSVMNYRFQMHGIEADCNLKTADHVCSYSEGMRLSLDESSLNEILGVANHYPVDWNGNGKIDDEPISGNVCNKHNQVQSGNKKERILIDSADWSALNFEFFKR